MRKMTPLRQRAATAVRAPGQVVVPNRRWGPPMAPASVTGGVLVDGVWEVTGPNRKLSVRYSSLEAGATYYHTYTRFDTVEFGNVECGEFWPPDDEESSPGSFGFDDPDEIAVLTGVPIDSGAVIEIETSPCAPGTKVFRFGNFEIRRLL